MEELYTVNQLAETLGITPRTLRFYEQEGLLSPSRIGNNRVYNKTDRERMNLILRGKRLGYSLNEIRDYLELYADRAAPTGQRTGFLARIRDHLTRLETQRLDVDEALAELREIEAAALYPGETAALQAGE